MPASSPAMLSLAVPVEVPSPERMEAIMREEFARVATERVKWFSPKEAAAYCNMAKSTFDRKKVELGLPWSEIGGTLSYHIGDLDRVKLLHLVTKGKISQQQPWPSLQERDEILRQQPAAA